MTLPLPAQLDRVLEALPRAYPGPGGAVAVLRDGQMLVRHAWGWANAERRVAFTPQTLFRICSITKQFTCGLLLDAFPDPSVLDADVRAHLPKLEQAPPSALHLCHNQSGLRDYWAVAMLHGAPAEAPFGDAEAARVIAGARTLQFAAGHPLFLCEPELPHPVRHSAGPHRPQLRRAAAHPHLRSCRHVQRAVGRRHRAPCRTAPRATRARRPAASVPRRTASSGPATPASAPASTT